MPASFQHALLRSVASGLQSYQARNVDRLRFCRSDRRIKEAVLEKLASVNLFRHTAFARDEIDKHIASLEPHLSGLEWLYKRLADEASRRVLLEVMAYRILGSQHVRIEAAYDAYWKGVQSIQENALEKARTHRVPVLDGWLDDFSLRSYGYPIRLCVHKINVLNTFILEQYHFRARGFQVEASPGDVVVDGGGCWGDTALYFACKVRPGGTVHVFEFSPANLAVLRRNISANPEFSPAINVHEYALWDVSGVKHAFNEAGPATALDGGDLKATTLALDEWAIKENVNCLDYIKLDVEGAERRVLKGGEQVIGEHKPKLAVALYHSLDDFVELPRLIDSMLPRYRFHLGHYTIHAEETILFAICE